MPKNILLHFRFVYARMFNVTQRVTSLHDSHVMRGSIVPLRHERLSIWFACRASNPWWHWALSKRNAGWLSIVMDQLCSQFHAHKPWGVFGLPIMRTIMSLWRWMGVHLKGEGTNISQDRQLFPVFRPMGLSKSSACLKTNNEQK